MIKKSFYWRAFIYSIILLACTLNYASESRSCEKFNDSWLFYKGELENGFLPDLDDSNWRQLNLPHDWSIEGPFSQEWASGTGYLPGGIGWYRKEFAVPEQSRHRKIFLYFHGVYKNSEVWINGNYLGKRPNGYISFQYDLTPFINFGGKNLIAVKVDHQDFDDSRWYTGSGIYRDVEVISTTKLYIKKWGVYTTTPGVSVDNATLDIQTTIMNEFDQSCHARLDNLLLFQNDIVGQSSTPFSLAAGQDAVVSQSMTIIDPKLWSVDNPNLYSLKTIINFDGQTSDQVITLTGFRDIRFDAEKGFFLNNKNLKLKGICMHHDAGCLGAAVPLKVWERRLDVLKEMGCNAIRTSHNAFSTAFLNLCDVKGFLVIDEVFDEWEQPKRKWVKGWNVGEPSLHGYAENFDKWHEQDLIDQVLRDRNHPSVFMWSIGNEIDYPNDPYTHEILNSEANPQTWATFDSTRPHANRLGKVAQELVAIVKKYDTTRPVTAGLASALMSNETGYAGALDVVGYNYQEFRYQKDHLKYPDRKLYGSENGMALDAWKAVIDNQFIMGQFLWTGIEYMGEAGRFPSRNSNSGAIDLAGNKKSEFYFRQSLWSARPMVYIGTDKIREDSERGGLWSHKRAEPHWNWKNGEQVRVKAFTNCETVELFLNDNSLGRQKSADFPQGFLFWDVAYEPGVIKAVAKTEDQVKEIVELKTAGKPARLILESDTNILRADNEDIAHIMVSIVDENNVPVYFADNRITCDIKGPARLLGIEDANSRNVEDYKDNVQSSYHGKALLYIQAKNEKGRAIISVSSDSLSSDKLEIIIGE